MVESIQIKEQSNRRLVFLDFIRGIAALAVFFQHALEKLYWSDFFESFSNWFSLGKFGVVLFFLTSGFIIPVSLERGGSAKRFWIGRFFRLYPIYWTSLFLVVILYLIGFDVTPKGFGENFAYNTLLNLTMFQQFVGVPPAQGLYETLTLEIIFYITCTILFLLKLHKKSYIWAWSVLILTVVASVLLPLKLHQRLPMAAIFYILSMFVGTVLYRYYSKVVTKRQVIQLLFTVFCVAVVGVYINYVLYKKLNGDNYTFTSVIASWTAGYAFFLGAFILRDRVFPKVFSWLGQISYSVYVLHPSAIKLTGFFPQPLGLAVSLVSTLILSSATFHFIEQPMIGFGRKIQKKIVAVQQRTNLSL